MVWIGRSVAALALGAVAVYLWRAGLERADKLGSAAGVLVAITALVAPYLLPLRRGAGSQEVRGTVVGRDLTQRGPAGTRQAVDDTRIGGDLRQDQAE